MKTIIDIEFWDAPYKYPDTLQLGEDLTIIPNIGDSIFLPDHLFSIDQLEEIAKFVEDNGPLVVVYVSHSFKKDYHRVVLGIGTENTYKENLAKNLEYLFYY